ncbi:MAG: DUF58 domain-containing protein [Planctomycetota bacterium]
MLTEELMRKVRQLQITTGRAVNEVFAGQYSSAFKGRGMEFAEVREYEPGDDVRTIDWNVTARSGTPYVKRFVEERELTIMLVVDLSASGSFGSIERIKNETAAELCAVLAFAAVRSNDKIGLMIFTDHVELYIPPKKGTNHVLRCIREVLDFEPRRTGTLPAEALRHLSMVLRRKAVVFLVSDFLFPGAWGEGQDARPFWTSLDVLNRRHDVISIHIADPRERELPRAGLIELEDAETGERRLVDTSSRRLRRMYASEAQRRTEELNKRMRRMGIDMVHVTTHDDYIHALVELFHRRGSRR